MSSVPFNFVQIPWLLFGLVIGGVQITAAVLLLRDRGAGPWIMLVGAVLSLLGSLSRPVVMMFIHKIGISNISTPLMITGGLSGLGGLLFTAGLLIFALQRRGLRSRIDELERITDPGR